MVLRRPDPVGGGTGDCVGLDLTADTTEARPFRFAPEGAECETTGEDSSTLKESGEGLLTAF